MTRRAIEIVCFSLLVSLMGAMSVWTVGIVTWAIQGGDFGTTGNLTTSVVAALTMLVVVPPVAITAALAKVCWKTDAPLHTVIYSLATVGAFAVLCAGVVGFVLMLGNYPIGVVVLLAGGAAACVAIGIGLIRRGKWIGTAKVDVAVKALAGVGLIAAGTIVYSGLGPRNVSLLGTVALRFILFVGLTMAVSRFHSNRWSKTTPQPWGIIQVAVYTYLAFDLAFFGAVGLAQILPVDRLFRGTSNVMWIVPLGFGIFAAAFVLRLCLLRWNDLRTHTNVPLVAIAIVIAVVL